MSKRTGLVRRLGGPATTPRSQQATETQGVPDAQDLEGISETLLPRDHPKWLRDRFVISTSTNDLLATLKPFAIRLLRFWDHRMHRLNLEHGTIQIDDSGAYRSV